MVIATGDCMRPAQAGQVHMLLCCGCRLAAELTGSQGIRGWHSSSSISNATSTQKGQLYQRRLTAQAPPRAALSSCRSGEAAHHDGRAVGLAVGEQADGQQRALRGGGAPVPAQHRHQALNAARAPQPLLHGQPVLCECVTANLCHLKLTCVLQWSGM